MRPDLAPFFMPLIKSAIKRVRVSERKRTKNLIVSKKYKELVKEFELLCSQGKIEEATKLFPTVQKALDVAAKKNLMHKNTVARRKSVLSKKLKADGTVKAEVKPAAKKAPAKKTAAKK